MVLSIFGMLIMTVMAIVVWKEDGNWSLDGYWEIIRCPMTPAVFERWR